MTTDPTTPEPAPAGEAIAHTCAACHGADHRGTVLSRAAADRTFNVEGRTVTIQKGEPVGCGHCHSISESFD